MMAVAVPRKEDSGWSKYTKWILCSTFKTGAHSSDAFEEGRIRAHTQGPMGNSLESRNRDQIDAAEPTLLAIHIAIST